MGNDKNANDAASEPDSPNFGDIIYSDWISAAGSTIEVSVNSKIWPETRIAVLQEAALSIFDDVLSEFGNTKTSVNLCLCGDTQMQILNQKYRQIDKPTNVLSFPAYDPTEHRIDWGVHGSLGDIIIAGETMAREADDMQIPVSDHLIHLFVHGLLHLFGFDHIDDKSAKVMESLEVRLLSSIGVTNPYQDIYIGVRNSC